MNNRLQQFLEIENLTPARLADIIGVQRSGMSHILSGRNKPGYDFIYKILTHFPDLNAEWFITGKGKPYKKNFAPTTYQEPVQSREARVEKAEERIGNRGYEMGGRDGNEMDGRGRNEMIGRDGNGRGGYEMIGRGGSEMGGREGNGRVWNEMIGREGREGRDENGEKSEDGMKSGANIANGNIQQNKISTEDNNRLENFSNRNDLKEEPFLFNFAEDPDFYPQNNETRTEADNSPTSTNMTQSTNNKDITPHKQQEQPQENREFTNCRGAVGQKRGVKRVVIYYNDGTFEELYPSNNSISEYK